MAVYTGAVLSGSSNGRPIPVAAVATPGTLIHTAPSGSVSFDEVYIWANNVTTATALLTVEWGGTAVGDHLTNSFPVPPNSLPIPIALGQRVQGAVAIKAFSATASAINITGYVNQVR